MEMQIISMTNELDTLNLTIKTQKITHYGNFFWRLGACLLAAKTDLAKVRLLHAGIVAAYFDRHHKTMPAADKTASIETPHQAQIPVPQESV